MSPTAAVVVCNTGYLASRLFSMPFIAPAPAAIPIGTQIQSGAASCSSPQGLL